MAAILFGQAVEFGQFWLRTLCETIFNLGWQFKSGCWLKFFRLSSLQMKDDA